jgi:hypothetical protein
VIGHFEEGGTVWSILSLLREADDDGLKGRLDTPKILQSSASVASLSPFSGTLVRLYSAA